MIERRIIIGLIVSTEFIKHIHSILNFRFFDSQSAKRLAAWCIEYYEKYNRAPVKDIEGIYYKKMKDDMDGELAEEIGEILEDLSHEFEHTTFNLDVALDDTREWVQEKKLTLHKKQIEEFIEQGELEEADKLAQSYSPLTIDETQEVDFSKEESLKRVRKAFQQTEENLIHYPRQIGMFWNRQLAREAFIAFLGSEKKGKSFMMLEMSIRACKQGKNVVYFQAGDMTENQHIKRMGVMLTKKHHNPECQGKMYEPVRDCIWNQLDKCDRKERECDFGVFEDRDEKNLKEEVTKDELINRYKDNPDYKACYNCPEYEHRHWGVPWVQETVVEELTEDEAVDAYEKFFIKHKRRFKLSIHASYSLTIQEIESKLQTWKRDDGFVPDIVLIDYADLLIAPGIKDERDKQHWVWGKLRGLSQDWHCLLVTGTQADADSYTKAVITEKNFSEDKRKHGHVTAEYGLNQDPKLREKRIGIMRLNKIMIREGDKTINSEVVVLQNLNKGQPVLESYFH